ncbi:MAG: iron-containing alcohol dehydrogenase [Thermoproteales archaeon]|nr:iron-containing alcohol dehydrogenase [Thermoproteales archaeon]
MIKRELKEAFAYLGFYPKVAIVDPELMLTLPEKLSVGTTVDALTHALEAYVNKDSNLSSKLYATEAIRIIGRFGPLVAKNRLISR